MQPRKKTASLSPPPSPQSRPRRKTGPHTIGMIIYVDQSFKSPHLAGFSFAYKNLWIGQVTASNSLRMRERRFQSGNSTSRDRP